MIGRKRPLEFQILGFRPAPWTPVDSLAVGRLLAWRLAENHQAELVRAVWRRSSVPRRRCCWRALSGQRADDIPRSARGRRRCHDHREAGTPPRDSRSNCRVAAGTRKPLPGLEWLSAGARRGNSNNWVLSGRKTKSGRPILANDPHLQIEFPSVWYNISSRRVSMSRRHDPRRAVHGARSQHAHCVGHHQHRRRRAGPLSSSASTSATKRVISRGQWVPIDMRRRTFPCAAAASRCRSKSGRRETGRSSRTRHRSEAPPAGCRLTAGPAEEQRAYALRWDAGGDIARHFERLNRATDWSSFTDAGRTFAVPSINMVYADVDGNIGYAMAGRVPVRIERRRHAAGRRQRGAGDGPAPSSRRPAPRPSTRPRATSPRRITRSIAASVA